LCQVLPIDRDLLAPSVLAVGGKPRLQSLSDEYPACFFIQKLKICLFLYFTFVFSLPALTFAVLSQNCGMVTTVEVETKFKG
jgi:hypothetical protein